MARLDAGTLRFDRVTVCGKPALFRDDRIDRGTVPAGLTMYEVRSDDDGKGEPCQIAIGVMVNFYGTLITRSPIALSDEPHTGNAYRDIDWSTEWIDHNQTCTLEEFMGGKSDRKELRKTSRT